MTLNDVPECDPLSLASGVGTAAGSPVSCTVDGRSIALPDAGTASVWEVLDSHGVTLPLGCASGHCGSCTILLDEAPTPACIVPHADARGRDVATIATASDDALVAAMMEYGAVQCGFCSPGIVVMLSWLIRSAAAERRVVSVEEVQEALTGHLCRCTGYAAVVSAAVAASEEIAGTGDDTNAKE